MKRTLFIAAIVFLPSFFLSAYIVSQQPHFSCNPEQFGLILLKGGYRSWFLSFSDGKVYRDGKWVSVVLDEQRGTMRQGYRLWPKFTHCDVPAFLKAHPEIHEVVPGR